MPITSEMDLDTVQTLRDDDMNAVVGCLNPQPLPPRYAFSNNYFSVSNVANSSLATHGIIIVGG